MTKPILLFFLVLAVLKTAQGQPTDNPVRTHYATLQEGVDLSVANHWTDSLAWSNITNIQAYASLVKPYTDQGNMVHNDWKQAIDLAISTVSNQGGGVVYLPALPSKSNGGDSSYYYSTNLSLADNVILRGDDPLIADAQNSAFAPPSILEFPRFYPTFTGNGTSSSTAFKRIDSHGGGSNTGLVNLEIRRAWCLFEPNWRAVTTSTGRQTVWPIEDKHNLIFFGLRMVNVAAESSRVPTSTQNAWQRYSVDGIANLTINATRNVMIAQCRLNDHDKNTSRPIPHEIFYQDNYKYFDIDANAVRSYSDGRKAPFSYTDHNAIMINRFRFLSSSSPRSYPLTFALPEEEPLIFARNIEIRDNWLYKTERIGIYAAGLGLIIKNNKILDADSTKNKWLSTSGRFRYDNSATHENRGIDVSGWHVRVDSNDVNVKRFIFGNGPYQSVDGEGILVQEWGGGTITTDYKFRNNSLSGSNSYLGIYKTRNISHMEISGNDLGNSELYIAADVTNNGSNPDYSIAHLKIENNTNINAARIIGTDGIYEVNMINNSGSGNINWTCGANLLNNSGLTLQTCKPQSNDPLGALTLLPNGLDSLVNTVSQVADFSSAIKERIYWSVDTGTLDSVEIYWNAKSIAKVGANRGYYDLDVPKTKDSYYLCLKGTSSAGAQAWSQVKDYHYWPAKIMAVADQYEHNSEAEALTIWPNPVSDILNFKVTELENPGKGVLEIIDILGRPVIRKDLSGHLSQINVSNLAAGPYILKWHSNNRQMTGQFLKK